MRLFIGGYAQGKLQYVLNKYTGGEVQVWDARVPQGTETEKKEKAKKTEKIGEAGVEDGLDKIIILNHLHSWVRERIRQGGCPEQELSTFLQCCPDCLIICDEVGNGIVPMEAEEREYRERLGRMLIELAAGAEEVERIICGIGQKIK